MRRPVQQRLIAAVIASTALLAATNAIGADVKPPAEQLAYRPNNLERLPKDWITTYPIQLDVAFNLKYSPDSPEAAAFLESWYTSLRALPHEVRLEVLRMVAPTRFQYQVSLRFNNWREYRVYEDSRGMLDYYYAKWKPFVLDSEERLSIVDPVTTTR